MQQSLKSVDVNIIIYENNSYGGCFEYALQVHKHLSGRNDINRCSLLIPRNAPLTIPNLSPALLPDISPFQTKLFRKFYFLYRSVINPLRLYKYLKNENGGNTYVVFNDFDQSTSYIWFSFLHRLKKKGFVFSIILHDPDRDAYFRFKRLSRFTMRKVMQLQNIAFFHDTLPAKPYYKKGTLIKYICIPHGIYPPKPTNQKFIQWLKQLKGSFIYASIPGNIRPEKNYEIAIRMLSCCQNIKLIIAGKPANSSVQTARYKQLAVKLKVENRIIWIERFLSDSELASVITISDIILLNYARSFKSQSGILHLIAPYKKKVIVADGENSLAKTVRMYNIGELVESNNLDSLVNGMKKIINSQKNFPINWDNYLKQASWNTNVEIIIRSLKTKNIAK